MEALRWKDSCKLGQGWFLLLEGKGVEHGILSSAFVFCCFPIFSLTQDELVTHPIGGAVFLYPSLYLLKGEFLG
jgi:hypothetical protein